MLKIKKSWIKTIKLVTKKLLWGYKNGFDEKIHEAGDTKYIDDDRTIIKSNTVPVIQKNVPMLKPK
jgi:hypothetical protein